MTKNNEPVIIFDPDISNYPVINPSSGLLPFIDALNPIGIIGKTLVEIMAYRVEIKRLRYEEIHIKEHAKVAQSYISAQVQTKMKQIENQRIALLQGLEFADKIIIESRVSRNELVRSLNEAMEMMKKLVCGRESPSTEVLEVVQGVISELSNCLVEFERNNVQQISSVGDNLKKIVQDTKRDLLIPPNL